MSKPSKPSKLIEPIGTVKKTNRGFSKVEFLDRYDTGCSLQQSSLATESAVWLGVDDANPQVMASNAFKVGIVTEETTGWVKYPIPEEVFLATRMHLTEDQVRSLIVSLQNWLDTGDFA